MLIQKSPLFDYFLTNIRFRDQQKNYFMEGRCFLMLEKDFDDILSRGEFDIVAISKVLNIRLTKF